MRPLRIDSVELAASVAERELLRLLGLPRGRELSGETRERVDAARAWYAANGRPFADTARHAMERLSADEVRLAGGTTLRSAGLADALRAVQGHAVLVMAVSAGREVAAEVRRLWADRPDEAYVLDRLGAGVAEALVLRASGDECRRLSAAGETLLPPLAPGCGRFELGDQQRLAALLGAERAPQERRHERSDGRLRLGPIEVLASGALDPPHSLLSACGVTRGRLPLTTPEESCRGCDLDPCAFRRAPRARPRAHPREAEAWSDPPVAAADAPLRGWPEP